MSCKFPLKNIFFAYLQSVAEGTKNSRWKRFRGFLRKKYRLVILNDSTFGEKLSIKLSPYGILIGVLAITIVMTTLVISLVAFTPLREYIPGYGDITERIQILKLSSQADSIEDVLEARDNYLKSLLNVVNERVESSVAKPTKDTTGKYAKVNTKASGKDLEFREEFEQNQSNASASMARIKFGGLSELVFFTPVKGLVSNSYDLVEEHYGVDIVTKPEETIKSCLDGTVIFTGFSAKDGNVIQIQHGNNLVSIYKHCASFLKKTGEQVELGEMIAIVGNTGEKSTGPHLHFELWFNGSSVNHQDFVAF